MVDMLLDFICDLLPKFENIYLVVEVISNR